jgi:hypothetical protein
MGPKGEPSAGDACFRETRVTLQSRRPTCVAIAHALGGVLRNLEDEIDHARACWAYVAERIWDRLPLADFFSAHHVVRKEPRLRNRNSAVARARHAIRYGDGLSVAAGGSGLTQRVAHVRSLCRAGEEREVFGLACSGGRRCKCALAFALVDGLVIRTGCRRLFFAGASADLRRRARVVRR